MEVAAETAPRSHLLDVTSVGCCREAVDVVDVRLGAGGGSVKIFAGCLGWVEGGFCIGSWTLEDRLNSKRRGN